MLTTIFFPSKLTLYTYNNILSLQVLSDLNGLSLLCGASFVYAFLFSLGTGCIKVRPLFNFRGLFEFVPLMSVSTGAKMKGS